MYWIIKTSSPYDEYLTLMGRNPVLNLGDFTWVGGGKIEVDLPTPMKFFLDPDSGDFLPAYFEPSIPLMSEKMLSVLSAAGVNNIQTYSTDIYDTNNKILKESYFAINIVGRIECVDFEKSDYRPKKSSKRFRFKKIIVDKDKIQGALLFRLHEKPSTVLIHNSVKELLEKEKLPGIQFKKASE